MPLNRNRAPASHASHVKNISRPLSLAITLEQLQQGKLEEVQQHSKKAKTMGNACSYSAPFPLHLLKTHPPQAFPKAAMKSIKKEPPRPGLMSTPSCFGISLHTLTIIPAFLFTKRFNYYLIDVFIFALLQVVSPVVHHDKSLCHSIDTTALPKGFPCLATTQASSSAINTAEAWCCFRKRSSSRRSPISHANGSPKEWSTPKLLGRVATLKSPTTSLTSPTSPT